MYAAIIAGGSGTRLWPKSRQDKPKQFQNLYTDFSMLQDTVKRLEPMIPRENIFIIAGRSHKPIILEQLPWINPDNVVGEPMGKDTAPAVGMIATIIHDRDPDAVILISPADHVITREDVFRSILGAAEQVASRNADIVTIGIKPTAPETGYGYIQMSEKSSRIDDIEVREVVSFKEKPSLATAEEYVSSWQYVWNSGMFVWSARTIIDLFEAHCPEIHALMLRYAAAIGTGDEAAVFEQVYDEFPRISVDYAILEHAKNIFVIPAAIGWSDLGSWYSLREIKIPDDYGNVVIGEHVGIDTHSCLIHGEQGRLIATIGLDNLVIVDTEDALLLLPAGRSQEIKDLLEQIKEQKKDRYL